MGTYQILKVLICTSLFLSAGPLKAGSKIDPDLKIGLVFPFSGPLAPWGKEVFNGASLALDEFHRQGKHIKLIKRDNAGMEKRSATAAAELFDRNRVHILMGGLSGTNARAMATVAEKKRRPMITPAAVNQTVTGPDSWVFRSCLSEPEQGQLLGRFAATDLGINRPGVLLREGSTFGRRLAGEFEKHFTGNGRQMGPVVTFAADKKSIRSAIRQLKRAGVRLVFLPVWSKEVPEIIRTARRSGLRAPFLGPDSWEGPGLGDHDWMDGNYFLTRFTSQDPDPRVRDFIRRFEERYHYKPGSPAAMGYDSMQLILSAFNTVNSNRLAALQRGLAGIRCSSLGGTIVLNKKPDLNRSAVIMSTTKKNPVYHKRISI